MLAGLLIPPLVEVVEVVVGFALVDEYENENENEDDGAQVEVEIELVHFVVLVLRDCLLLDLQYYSSTLLCLLFVAGLMKG